jgi:ferredoxin
VTSGRRFTVRVDADVCVGNAMCRAALPNVFVEGPDGKSVTTDASASLEEVLEAALDCPVGAIHVDDADTLRPIDTA